jgi:lysophospholipase L1-like esterase
MSRSPALVSLPGPLDHVVRLLVVAVAVTACACSSPSKPTPPPAGPTLACPTGMTDTSPDGMPKVISYVTPTADGGASPVSVSCTPASGSTFPVGITSVSCTARDTLGRQATCSFSVQLAPPPLRLNVTVFLAFGDSLTEGKIAASAWPHTLQDFPTSYTRHLQGLLRTRYVAQAPTVANEGLGGERATDGVTRLPGAFAAHRPGAVLLLEGANDLNSLEAAIRVVPASEAMKRMVQLTKSAAAVPFLATLPPQRPGGTKALGAAYVEEYNRLLRRVASQEGAVLVDVWEAFGGERALTAIPALIGADGLHLTEEGYKKLGETFFEAIRSRLEVTSAAQPAGH